MDTSLIEQLWALGCARWPEFSLTLEELSVFARDRHETLVLGEPAEAAEDLYLACGCAHALPGALRAFEGRHGADIAATLRRMGLPPTLQAEITQAIRTKLFVAAPGSPPPITRYGGRGRLGGWARTVAVRVALDTLRAEKSDEVPMESHVLDALAETEIAPDLRAFKQRYAAMVNEAFTEGFAGLSPRQRNLLRQHYLNHLNIDQLGTMHGVHRVTAFRWIAAAREQVFETARRHVAASTAAPPHEADDLLRLLKSQLDLSLDRLLRTSSGD